MATTRLSKEARREQLLDTALGIVRAHGPDDLTLVTLAEVHRDAGRYTEALAEALQTAPPTAGALAHVLSAAYFACATDIPEFAAVSAALKGNPEMEAIQHELLEGYTAVMATALAPHSTLPSEALRLRCVGVLGAAEAIAAELHQERTTSDEAVAALTDLILGSVAITTAHRAPER